MKLNKFFRMVIASVFSVGFIYITLALRGAITPSLNHFFYNLLIWSVFFMLVLLGASYYQKVYNEESLNKIEKEKNKKVKKAKKAKRRKP